MTSQIDLGSVAEWFAAVGTIAAVVVALYIATRETRRLQKRDRADQAHQISAWRLVQLGFGEVVVSNASSLPIYDVLISYGVAYGAGPPFSLGNANQTFVVRIPPGRYLVKEPKHGGGGMSVLVGPSISFRDANGLFWRRDAKGELIATKASPFIEMEIKQPISTWVGATPIK